MEEFLVRFPGIGEDIFNQLDNQTLARCREVSRSQHKFLEKNKVLWKRMIEKYSANNVEFKDAWKLVVERVPVQNVKELAIAVEQFYSFRPHRLKHQHSPHHIAAECGNLSLCKFIVKKTGVLNPARSDGCTGLHFAVQERHFDVCQYIINNAEDKNPKDNDGFTPLESASLSGRFEIFKLILDTQSEKNPKNWFGTLLHLAAGGGHVDVYRYISEGLEDKNPTADHGCTPLHIAARLGHFKVFEHIANSVSDLNLFTPGTVLTPLHLAAAKGHLEIVKYITEHVIDKNPPNVVGTTPLHEAAKKGHLQIYKCIADQVTNKNPAEIILERVGRTPLHDAAANGHIEIVNYIMDVIVIDNKNPKDHEGWTPMHLAVGKGYYKICKVIIDHGANPNPTNNAGISALDLAHSNQEIQDLIGFWGGAYSNQNPKKRKLQHIEK